MVRENGARLRVAYRIAGDLARLRIPPPGAPGRTERLWEHTCCELFVGRRGEAAYHEFNFSPSGEWAAYAFSAYRSGAPAQATAPAIAVRVSGGLLELDVAVQAPADGALRIGLSVVIEELSGTCSYWALRHPAGRPDFHHPEAFAAELA